MGARLLHDRPPEGNEIRGFAGMGAMRDSPSQGRMPPEESRDY